MPEAYGIPAQRGYIQLGGTRLSYLDWGGAGSPALLLHGVTSSAATLWRVAPDLVTAGYRPLALDMPGHGESDVSADHAIDTIAGLVGGVIATLGLGSITLIGHSWGGAAALALAGGQHQARGSLARVVLVDPLLGFERRWGDTALPRYVAGVGEPAATGLAVIRANNPTWLDEEIDWKAVAMEQCRREQVEGLFRPSASWDLVAHLGQVAVPLLVLVADLSATVIPVGRLDEVRAALRPGSGQLELVPGTTHNMLRGLDYEPTMAVLVKWLSGA